MAQPATDPPLPPFESLAKSQKKEYLDARSQEDVAADGRAQAGRKKLAEQTKAFRGYVTTIPASSDEQLMTHFGTLLKAYQQEVDSLTKRARAAEGALQYVAPWIRSTVDAPPPVAAPPATIDVSKFQLEIEALNETLEDKELQAQMLRAERDKMAASLQNAEKAKVELAEDLIAAKKEITTLGEALAAKDAQYAEEIERLNSTAVTLQSDLSAAVARAEEIVASSQRREGELRHKCAALEASFTEAEARAQSAVSKANESTVQLQQRDEELHNKAKEVREYESKISALNEELNHVRLNLSQLEVAKPTTTEEPHHIHHPHHAQPAPKEEALIVLEAVGGMKDSGAALHQHHAHPHIHPQSQSQLPSVTAKLLTDEEDDAWGWKDDEDKPTAAAAAAVVPMVASVRVEAAVPMPPSPVKSSPALVSASELQNNIAQLMVREDASEEELEKLEDMHHEQLRKIARAKWQLLKRQVLGNRH